MIMKLITAALGPLSSIGGTLVEGFVTGRKDKAETARRKVELDDVKHARRLDVIKEGRINEATWNEQQIEKSGWARDWITILLSIPLVLAFVPQMVDHVHRGFGALEQMPPWYKSAVGLMIAATYGYQKYVQHTMNKAYSLPPGGK